MLPVGGALRAQFFVTVNCGGSFLERNSDHIIHKKEHDEFDVTMACVGFYRWKESYGSLQRLIFICSELWIRPLVRVSRV